MMPFIQPSTAQASYDGPEDLRLFADFLPALGEVVIAFSRVERRLTWAIESIIGADKDDAHKMEDFVKNVSSRIAFLELIGLPVARETDTETEFVGLLLAIRATNRFRNSALHNGFSGVRSGGGDDPNAEVIKQRYDEKPEKRSYRIALTELRDQAVTSLALCVSIQHWVLVVRPEAENRVP